MLHPALTNVDCGGLTRPNHCRAHRIKRAIVIGGGPAGLKAAQTVASPGVEVLLLESAPTLGGLASTFDLDGVAVERYYHFVCSGDRELIDALADLGLASRLRWCESGRAHFVDGRLYPFQSPMDLLRFRPLAPLQRIRAGAGLRHACRCSEPDLASQPASRWLTSVFGKEAYRIIWEPLLRFKFAHHADQVSAAWVQARMVRLTGVRPRGGQGKLGYIEGGTQTLISALARELSLRAVRVQVSSPVDRILVRAGRAVGVRVAGMDLPADVVISTIPLPELRRVCTGLPEHFRSRLAHIPTLGIICTCLRLRRRLTPYFWVNANDSRIPFAGVIELTNLTPVPALDGDHLLYIPQYLPTDDPRYVEPDPRIVERQIASLSILNPEFGRGWIRSSRVLRSAWAQPVCLTDYRLTTPTVPTPIRGLYITDSCQLHPGDRSISGALALGRLAGQMARDDLLLAAQQRAEGIP